MRRAQCSKEVAAAEVSLQRHLELMKDNLMLSQVGRREKGEIVAAAANRCCLFLKSAEVALQKSTV